MTTCRKLTVKERLADAAQAAGGKLTREARETLELSLALTPAPYVCTGSGVGSAATSKRKRKRRD